MTVVAAYINEGVRFMLKLASLSEHDSEVNFLSQGNFDGLKLKAF